MRFEAQVLRARQWLLAVALFLSATFMWPSAVEPFVLPKSTMIHLLALGLVGLWLALVVRRRTLHLMRDPVAWAVAGFVLAAVVATVASSSPWTSLIGLTTRSTGLLSYSAYAVVFLTAVSTWNSDLFRLLRASALAALTVATGYGVLQAAGMEFISWRDGVDSTFGNIDFAGAWVGAASALAVVTLLDAQVARAWRLFAGVLLVASLAYTVLTTTSQGPVVALVATGWAAAVMLTRDISWVHGRRKQVAGVAAVASLILVGGVVASWSFISGQLEQAMVERPDFWLAALRIFQDHPVVGTGLDTFGHYFPQYRPASHAVTYGIIHADAPHSVPLSMLSNGGVLLAATHVAFVAVVGFYLVRGLRSVDGEGRLALGGFGGAWLGYQAQSLISYDVPPMAFLHWLSAGVIVAVAASPRFVEVRLPGKAPERRKVRGRAVGDELVPASTKWLLGAVGVATAVGMWFVAQPMRADFTAAEAADLGAQGQIDAATAELKKAADINPAEAMYLFQAARAQEVIGRPAEAAELATEAAQRDPGAVQYLLLAARQAQVAGDMALAEESYRAAAELDPRHPAILAEVAAFFADQGDEAEAEIFARRATELDPNSATAQEVLAEIAAAG